MIENRIFHKVPLLPMRLWVCGLIILILTIQIGSASIFLQDETAVTGAQLIESLENSSTISATPFPIQFFYNTHCGSCQAALQYLDEFTLKHPDVPVDYHDLFNNTTSFALYEDYKIQFNRSDLHYPVIFMGNVGIMGSDDIAAYTEPLALWYQKNVKVDPVTGFVTWIESLFKKGM